jgi:hypothetical protein
MKRTFKDIDDEKIKEWITSIKLGDKIVREVHINKKEQVALIFYSVIDNNKLYESTCIRKIKKGKTCNFYTHKEEEYIKKQNIIWVR